MIFCLALMILVEFVLLTIMEEYHRSKSLTLLSFVSLGNILYMGATPAIYYFLGSAAMFEGYVSDSGLVVEESGLTRVLMAAAVFQFVCLCVSIFRRQKRPSIRPDSINSKSVLRAAIRVGWIMALIGATGVLWLGLKYNGNPWGLYEISYFERTTIALENPLQAFMLLLGIYGAAQLIVVFLLSQRSAMAVLILLAMTLHGLGMKSKFPVFWVLLVFLVVAIGQGKKIFKLLLPIGFSVLILSTMSILRGVTRLSELPEYIDTYWSLLGVAMATPWENDLPGPVSILYYVLNSNAEYTIRPLTEVLSLLVPRFLFERGPLLSDVWAEKMLGVEYDLGMGFGWSPICDGYLLLGWLGIGLVALVFALLARYISDLGTEAEGRHGEFFTIVAYCSAPFFLFSVRGSMGGLIKQLLIITVFLWLPTFFLANIRRWRAIRFWNSAPDPPFPATVPRS